VRYTDTTTIVPNKVVKHQPCNPKDVGQMLYEFKIEAQGPHDSHQLISDFS